MYKLILEKFLFINLKGNFKSTYEVVLVLSAQHLIIRSNVRF